MWGSIYVVNGCPKMKLSRLMEVNFLYIRTFNYVLSVIKSIVCSALRNAVGVAIETLITD